MGHCEQHQLGDCDHGQATARERALRSYDWLKWVMVYTAVCWIAPLTNAGISPDALDLGGEPHSHSGWANVAGVEPTSGNGAGIKLQFVPTLTLVVPAAPFVRSVRHTDPTTVYLGAGDLRAEDEYLWGEQPRTGAARAARRAGPDWSPPVPAALRPYQFVVPIPVAAEFSRRMGIPLDPPTDSAQRWNTHLRAMIWAVVSAAGIAFTAAWRVLRKFRGSAMLNGS